MKNRSLPSFQFVLLVALAALVVVFYFQTRLMDLDRHSAESKNLLHLQQLDTLLEEEALKGVSLQLLHYDNIVTVVGQIKKISSLLRAPDTGIYGVISPALDRDLDDYTRMMEQKIDLIETIKARIAIVRNTINYLPAEVARITQHGHDDLYMEMHLLLSGLLAQNLNPNAQNLKALEEAIAHIQSYEASGEKKASVDLVLRHVKANMRASADINKFMAEFLSLPMRAAIDRISAAHTAFALDRIKTADQFRIVLLGLSMILFIGLGVALNSLRTARDEAQRTSRQFRDAAQSITEGFAFFDSDGRLQFWNGTFEALHAGCGDALKVGTTFVDFFNTCVANGVYAGLNVDGSDDDGGNTLNLDAKVAQTYTVRGQNDTWMLASDSPMEDGGTASVRIDISDTKRTMAELTRAKEMSEMANQAKTQFLANMSHELRTQLNAIIGFSEVLTGQMFGPLGSDQYVDYSGNILESGHHLLDVINDILDISSIEIGTMEIRESEVDMRALCLSCLEMVREQADYAQLSLHQDLAEHLNAVAGDQIRLKQIILNLLGNAVKFTPEGGEVELKAYTDDAGQVTVQVRDTGYGIPADQHKKILEPFGQVGDIYTRSHDGSGLGLFLVRSFVDLHDGTLAIESKIDKGSTFTVTLPHKRTIAA